MNSSHFLVLPKLLCLTVLSISNLNACATSPPSVANSVKLTVKQPEPNRSSRGDSLDQTKLNKQIDVHGTAENAMLGAVVMTDDLTPVFLDGVREWDSKIVGKLVIVKGVLRRKLLAPKATVGSNREISQGVEGDSYVLENPIWSVER